MLGWSVKKFPIRISKPNLFHMKALTFVKKMRGHLFPMENYSQRYSIFYTSNFQLFEEQPRHLPPPKNESRTAPLWILKTAFLACE